ncbi:hypothetical protein N8Z33_01460 [Flavobacteriaceae bacterium]|nr:hypothetical protein [Flavobacteriaceae bacterium]
MKCILNIVVLTLLMTSNSKKPDGEHYQNGMISVVKVEKRFHNQVYYDVFLTNEKETINLTKFDPWTEIVDYQLSNDSAYLFVRYKPNVRNAAYRLALFNLKDYRKVNEIIPGLGGIFEWNTNNQILHSSSCGTNCGGFRVYDLKLKKVLETFSSGGYKLSPHRNTMIQSSRLGRKFWVYDLTSINESETINTYSKISKQIFYWTNFEFIDNQNILISGIDSIQINLERIEWTRLQTLEIDDYNVYDGSKNEINKK